MVQLKEWQIQKNNGIFDKRNRVNDLTGKEWLFSTRSVKTKRFSFYFDIRELLNYHYIDFIPIELFSELILTFSKSNDVIIDPISNFGSTGYAAGNSDSIRNYIGFNFMNNVRLNFFKDFNMSHVNFFNNSLKNNLDKISKNNNYIIMTELIFTSLEYEDRMSKYQEFENELLNSLESLLNLNFNINYIIIAIQNTKDTSKYEFHTKAILNLLNSFDFNLKSELIWKIHEDEFYIIKTFLLSKSTNETNIEKLLNDKRILIFKRD